MTFHANCLCIYTICMKCQILFSGKNKKNITICCAIFSYFFQKTGFDIPCKLSPIISLIFPRKQDMTFHANCLHWRQFAWNVKSCFLGKIRKRSPVMSPAESAKRVLKVKSIKKNNCCEITMVLSLLQHHLINIFFSV